MSHEALQKHRLENLKKTMFSGAFDELQKKKEQEKLRKIISGALFLEKDEKRKKLWINAIPILSIEEMRALSSAILRENLRYKKRERDLKLEKIPQKLLPSIP